MKTNLPASRIPDRRHLTSRYRPLLALIIIALCFSAGACKNGTPITSGGLTIRLVPPRPEYLIDDKTALHTVTPSTLLPAISIEITEYAVSGTGPDDASFQITVTGESCEITSLELGSWTISVEGSNADGTIIATGESTIEVASDSSVHSISLYLVPGDGDVEVTVSISGDIAEDTVVTSVLDDTTGSTVSLGTQETEPGIYVSSGTVAAGIYLLRVELADGEGIRLAGGTEVVYVIRGATTRGEIDLTHPPEDTGMLELSFDLAFSVPPGMTLSSVEPPPYFPVSPVTLSVSFDSMNTPPSGYGIEWFLDGNHIDASGMEYVFEPSERGTYRFDTIAYDGNLPVGSESLSIDVIPRLTFGDVTYLGALYDNTGAVDGLSGVRDCTIHPNGSVLYAAGYDESSISIFDTGIPSALPTYVTRLRAGLDMPFGEPCSLSVSPNGMFLAVAGGTADFVLFGLDPSGMPTETHVHHPATDSAAEITSVVDIAFSGDGEYLFAACDESDRLLQYQQTGTGAYAYAGNTDLSALVPPVDEPIDIETSPDGRWIAVCGKTSDSVSIYDIDPLTGSIALAGHFVDGDSGVDGLNGGGGLVFSSDGNDLYAAGYYDDAITHFRFTSLDGWAPVTCYRDGESSVEGMHYPRDVAISADGEWLYVTASGDDSLTVFGRDPIDGSLTFEDVALNGGGTVSGLDGARGVCVNPLAPVVYVVSSNDNSLTTFSDID